MEVNTAALNRTQRRRAVAKPVFGKHLFVDDVQRWLEGKESLAQFSVGCGICGLALLYLLGSMVRAVF